VAGIAVDGVTGERAPPAAPTAGIALIGVTGARAVPGAGATRAAGRFAAGAAGIGNAFEVVVRDRPYRAEQVKLPFYRRPRD